MVFKFLRGANKKLVESFKDRGWNVYEKKARNETALDYFPRKPIKELEDIDSNYGYPRYMLLPRLNDSKDIIEILSTMYRLEHSFNPPRIENDMVCILLQEIAFDRINDIIIASSGDGLAKVYNTSILTKYVERSFAPILPN